MPELPEVEHVRRTLEPHLVGARVVSVRLNRRDIVVTAADPPGGRSRAGKRQLTRPRPVPRADLLAGATITSLVRRGKQLAIIARDPQAGAPRERVLLVHLGMSGQLFFLPTGRTPERSDHIHAVWTLDGSGGGWGGGGASGRLVFRDPRRFGGLWTIGPPALLAARWATLGPDALTIDASEFGARLAGTKRPIKAALLDQIVIAGVGNIYADEALFLACLHPARRASSLAPADTARLAQAIRAVLTAAIDAGGSTLRDYISADGDRGRAQLAHKVYARAGRPCLSCGTTLKSCVLAQRTTTWCPKCQHRTA
jgi:formamidopyrimidine-DNA glycosylase